MKILITDVENKYTEGFFDFLIRKTQTRFFENLNVKKLESFEVFINESPRYKSLFRKYISAYDICVTALHNLKVLRYETLSSIVIDNTVLMPGTSIKVLELCKLIDEGNLGLKAYPIFSNTFKEVQGEIETYYAEYVFGE